MKFTPIKTTPIPVGLLWSLIYRTAISPTTHLLAAVLPRRQLFCNRERKKRGCLLCCVRWLFGWLVGGVQIEMNQLWTNLRTKDESQQLELTRILDCLQYLVPSLSRMQRIYPLQYYNYYRTKDHLDQLMGCKACAYSYSSTIREGDTVAFSMDSDLEAFSHNPTDGSVGALSFQATPRTKYPKKRFLSYWVLLL